MCVPFTILSSLKEQIKGSGLPIALGAQDVSPYPEGAYTGEVSAPLLKKLGAEIKEYDISPDMIKEASKKIGKENVYSSIKEVPDN